MAMERTRRISGVSAAACAIAVVVLGSGGGCHNDIEPEFEELESIDAVPAGPALSECTIGTRSVPSCDLQASQQEFDAQVSFAEDERGSRHVYSGASYGGTSWCPDRFTLGINGDYPGWTRIVVKPKGSLGSNDKAWPCICENLEISVQVLGASQNYDCQGGCVGCTVQEWCDDVVENCECSFTPLPGPLDFEVVSKRVRGQWIPATMTAPGRCELVAQIDRTEAGVEFSELTAVAYDARDRSRYPIDVWVYSDEDDPYPDGSGNCCD